MSWEQIELRRKNGASLWVVLLAATARMVLASGSLSFLLAQLDLRGAMLPVLGSIVFVSGVMYLGRALVHKADPSYSDQAVIGLVASDISLGYAWIVIGLLLALLGLLPRVPVVLPILGGVACCGLYLRGWTAGDAIVRKEKRLGIDGGSEWVDRSDPVRLMKQRSETGPLLLGAHRLPALFGRKRPHGQLSLFLTVTLLCVAYTGLAYAGMAVIDGVEIAARHHGDPGDSDEGAGTDNDEGENSNDAPAPTYAQLCPDLEDPQDIEAGLGDLFEHDGAVAAGCGHQAVQVGPATWIAPGYCGSALRSLAVVGEGRKPILLYGRPARLALEEGLAGTLRFAEAAEPAGGEIVLVTTAFGSYAFSRTSPVLRQGDGEAVRCEEVDEVARPFAELPPAMTGLWIYLMQLEEEWVWPEPLSASSRIRFTSPRGGTSYGSCDEGVRCWLEGGVGLPPSEAAATVALDDLERLPPPLPGLDPFR